MGVELVEDDYLDNSVRALFDSVAGKDSVPAAGSVIAAMGALAAGLAAKVAHRSAAQLPNAENLAQQADGLRKVFEPIIASDAEGYATALTKRGDDRATALLSLSADLVLLLEASADVAELAATLADSGNQNLRYDADAAVRIAVTVAEIGAELIGANVEKSKLSARALSAVGRARAAASVRIQ